MSFILKIGDLVADLSCEWCVLRVAGFVRIRMPATESHRILTNPATKKHLALSHRILTNPATKLLTLSLRILTNPATKHLALSLRILANPATKLLTLSHRILTNPATKLLTLPRAKSNVDFLCSGVAQPTFPRGDQYRYFRHPDADAEFKRQGEPPPLILDFERPLGTFPQGTNGRSVFHFSMSSTLFLN